MKKFNAIILLPFIIGCWNGVAVFVPKLRGRWNKGGNNPVRLSGVSSFMWMVAFIGIGTWWTVQPSPEISRELAFYAAPTMFLILAVCWISDLLIRPK